MEQAFARDATTPPWGDPNPGREPDDAAYSRVTDPARWRIVRERVDAWGAVLESAGLATIERDVEPHWEEPPGPTVERTDRIVPHRPAAVPITVARSMGVVIGVGDPATRIAVIPDCGCDACDSGSADALEEVDRVIAGVVGGTFRHLRRRDRFITVTDGNGWTAANMRPRPGWRRRGRDRIAEILDDPTGWTEISGPPWTA